VTFGGKSRTKAQDARFDAIKRGHCLACLQRGIDLRGQGLVQVHHLRGKKYHDLTVGLCYWHHQAGLFFAHTHAHMREHYGPSLAEGSKPFHQAFGSDASLLDMQNELLGVK
jgi:hypothetical protein